MIRLSGVSKVFPDGTRAVADLDLEIPRGELVALVGPSGCGKSTTLRMVNRLIEPTSGRIVIDDQDVTDMDPVRLRRKIGYVIQQIGLFPHQRVEENVATVPRLLGWDKSRIQARSRELLEMVGLDPEEFGRRFPHELSGGQRQRVGVARALAADPPVLLMDEPFGAVDPLARERLQREFRQVQERLGTTVMLVTHDIDEAMLLADRVAVLRQGGFLEQFDTPDIVLGAPASEFVKDFVGSDRGLRRLAVTPIDVEDLEQPPVSRSGESSQLNGDWGYGAVVDASRRLVGWWMRDNTVSEVDLDGIEVGQPLREGLSRIVLRDTDRLPVFENGRYVGVLTAAAVHRTLRRTTPDRERDVSTADTQLAYPTGSAADTGSAEDTEPLASGS